MFDSGAHATTGTAREAVPIAMHLHLFGEFLLEQSGLQIELPTHAARALAYAAVAGRPVARHRLAGALWPDSSEEHAHGNLRSALNRLEPIQRTAFVITPRTIQIADSVRVDWYDARDLARRLDAIDALPDAGGLQNARSLFSHDLLPAWDEEWIALEARHWREIRLHTLQMLTRKLSEQGRVSEAIEVAGSAISADPLRESLHVSLLQVYLAAGNHAAAASVRTNFRTEIRRETGVEASPQLDELMTRDAARIATPQTSVVPRVQAAMAGAPTTEFVLVASGASMEPTIRDGDTLLVSPDVTLAPGRIVAGIRNGAWIVKRLAERAGTPILRSDNDAEQDIEMTDVDIRGVVVELRRAT